MVHNFLLTWNFLHHSSYWEDYLITEVWAPERFSYPRYKRILVTQCFNRLVLKCFISICITTTIFVNNFYNLLFQLRCSMKTLSTLFSHFAISSKVEKLKKAYLILKYFSNKLAIQSFAWISELHRDANDGSKWPLCWMKSRVQLTSTSWNTLFYLIVTLKLMSNFGKPIIENYY